MRIHKVKKYTVVLGFLVLNYGCSGQKSKPLATAPGPNLITATEIATKTFDLSKDFNGFNAQMMRGPSWKAPGFIERVKELHPGVIRYPGGTVASYWDWKTGWLMEGIELRKEWKSISVKNPIKLEDLKFACDQTLAHPLFVLNMMNSTVSYQIEMLKEAVKMGLTVKYIELDNEIYLGEIFYVNRFPTGTDYAKEANQWISAIKKEFPNVQIAVVGSSVKENAANKGKKYADRTRNWNSDVVAEIKNADAMTFHVYAGSGLNYLAKDASDEDSEGTVKLESFQSEFEKTESMPFILGSPFLRWNTTNGYDYKILPSNMKAWITEYNLFEKEGVMAGTWSHGLYALSQTLLFMEDQKTELICFHNLTTSAQFAAIFNNTEGFAKAYKSNSNKKFDFTAAGYCLSLSGSAMADGGKAVKIKFGNNIMQQSARGKEYTALNGWVVKTSNNKRVIVTNLSATAVAVDFSQVISGKVQYTQMSSEPTKQIASEKDINRVQGEGSKITLLPYSVTLLTGE